MRHLRHLTDTTMAHFDFCDVEKHDTSRESQIGKVQSVLSCHIKEPALCRPLHDHLEALLLTICGLTAESRTLTQISTLTRPLLRALFQMPSSRKTASAMEVTEKVPDQSHHSCRLLRNNGPGQPHCISAPRPTHTDSRHPGHRTPRAHFPPHHNTLSMNFARSNTVPGLSSTAICAVMFSSCSARLLDAMKPERRHL